MAYGAARRRDIERALRAHPAGSALRRPPSLQPAGGPDDRAGGSGASVPPRAPLRLTARGRRLVAVLGVACGVGGAALVGSVLDGGGGDGLHLVGQSSVVVRSGDTLWSIASTVAGDDDIRAVVDRIRQVNGLHGSDLVPGEVLLLP